MALCIHVYGNATDLTGSRTNVAGGGLVGSKEWGDATDQDVTVTWLITDNNMDGSWDYKYT